MKHLRTHGATPGMIAAIFFLPTLVSAGLAAVGSTVGFRKWWGVLLVIPSLLLSALGVYGLALALVTDRAYDAGTVGLLVASGLPIVVAAVVIRRWTK
jgi:Ni/Fe-hydrogenase subunit HybB-like protein